LRRAPQGPALSVNVLILCTHNSARSVLAEAMLNHWAARTGTAVRGYSAGSAAIGRVNPHALEALARAGVPTAGLRSKSWDEFTGSLAPPMRIVITVCDSAAGEACPLWTGSPVRTHWGYPDPSLASEPQRPAAFDLMRQALSYRLLQLLQLPLASMGDAELKQALERIGTS
jgi:arsenate reductase (thioredoxin)